MTLGLGLMLTLLFAAAAVGTLNLVSVGFGILFVGIAVDFAIQFSRALSRDAPAVPRAGAGAGETGRRVGGQILVAAAATAAGFLAFVPTDFRGVAELGLIAGVGMLIAFFCTMTFLPAAISLFRPHGEQRRSRLPLGGAAGRRGPAPPHADARRVCRARVAGPRPAAADRLRRRPAAHQEPEYRGDADVVRLGESPLTNPFTIDILAAEPDARRASGGTARKTCRWCRTCCRSTASCRRTRRRSWP